MNRPHFVRFHDLDQVHVNRDLQIHTRATDGEATVKEIVARAHLLGLKEIAFTEHVRRSSSYFHDFVREVQEVRRGAVLEVYVGIETKALDMGGTIDAPLEALAEAEIVLGSVHRFPARGGEFIHAEEVGYREAADLELELALSLLRFAPIHVLAHPGGMCQRAFGKFPESHFIQLMEASLERGIAIEINTSYTRDLDGFVALCRKSNPLVSIGSDVHRLSELGTCRNALWARGIGCG